MSQLSNSTAVYSKRHAKGFAFSSPPTLSEYARKVFFKINHTVSIKVHRSCLEHTIVSVSGQSLSVNVEELNLAYSLLYPCNFLGTEWSITFSNYAQDSWRSRSSHKHPVCPWMSYLPLSTLLFIICKTALPCFPGVLWGKAQNKDHLFRLHSSGCHTKKLW